MEITIVAKERYPYYARVRLPELLSASPPGSPPIGAEDLALFKPSWYAERGIKVISFDSGVRKDGRTIHLSPSSNALIGEKLVKLTHRGFSFKCWANATTGGYVPGDSAFAINPPFHIAGFFEIGRAHV